MATSMSNGTFSDTDTDYDSGISINGQEEVEELERLIRDRLDGDGGQAWKLGWSPLGGRGVIATSDLQPGDLIFTDIPIALGPRGGMEGGAICVSCFRSEVQLKPCSKGCRLPICSAPCQESHSNSPECSLLLRLGVQEGDSWSPELYRALTPFRCLSLPKRDKEIIKMLQAHPQNELATEVSENAINWLIKYVLRAKWKSDNQTLTNLLVLQSELQIKLLNRGLKSEMPVEDQKWLDLCCRVLNAVAFQAVTDDFESKQSPIRGLYPLAGLMNHSCMPNTRQVFDANHRLNLIAVKHIVEREEITTSYCPLLWATPVRINFLLKTKHFICSCQRCRDPTEMDTYLAGLVCGCGGMILPVDPQEPKSEWKCSCCARSLSSGQALIASSILASNPGKSRNNLSLTNNNHLVVDGILKAIFSQRNNLKDMNESELTERENKIRHVLQLVNQLQLGECRTKGLLLHELHSTQKEKELRCTNQTLQDFTGLLVEAKRILEGDISIPKDILLNVTEIN